MTTTTTTAANGRPANSARITPAAMAPPPKLKRRPMLVALGVVLVALGGLVAAYVVTSVSDTRPVLALRTDVDRGAVIQAGDLVVAQVDSDPALDPVPADQRGEVVGERAARDLSAGSLLTRQSFTDAVVPATGESLVGVALTAAQLPAANLRPGDSVRIVNTPRPQDDLDDVEPATIGATVVDVRDAGETGDIVVDVTVPTSKAATLAAMVGTARIALVVDGSS